MSSCFESENPSDAYVKYINFFILDILKKYIFFYIYVNFNWLTKHASFYITFDLFRTRLEIK